MPVVKIIAPEPVRFSSDGFTPVVYDPGEFYDVPPHVARGMMDPARNWARFATQDDVIPASLPTASPETARPVAATASQPEQSAEPPVDTNRRPKRR